jgi:hypothetical protein
VVYAQPIRKLNVTRTTAANLSLLLNLFIESPPFFWVGAAQA